jgi:hypothetical protein
VNIRAALLIAGTGTLLAVALQASAAPVQGSPRTLLTTRGTIVSFAQDGSVLAWVERPAGKRCRRILHIRHLGKGHDTTARIGCGRNYDDLALAGTRVLWNHLAEGTSLTRDVDVMTMAAGERRPRRLEQVHVDFDPVDCYRLELTCRPEREPVLAGGGGLLAYSTPTGVRRVVRGARRALLPFPAARKLAVSGGRVLAFRFELRPGDGCGCASTPAWLPDGTIEYLSHVGGSADQNGELTRIAADGSGRQVLTSDRRFRQSLDVSVDGTKVAYGYVIPADPPRWLIAVAAPDGSGAHDIGEGQDPAWSPDGSRLAFERGSAGSRQIYVMDADGGGVTQLTQGAESTQPAWSPDGTRIAYVVNGGISLMRADGSEAHSLGLEGSAPDWSPDGSRLVFVGASGISIANADGSNVREVVPSGGATPRWSPDGSSIVFERATQWWDVNERYELYLVHPDGSGLQPLTFSVPAGWASPAEVGDAGGRLVSRFELPGAAFDAALGAQNSALGDFTGPRTTSVELFDTATGSPRGSLVLTENSFMPQLVGISGRWLVFHVDRTISGLDLTSSKRTTFAVAGTSPIGLSLSGNRLAWAENPRGHGRIVAVTLPR